jgi:hypothetical protein
MHFHPTSKSKMLNSLWWFLLPAIYLGLALLGPYAWVLRLCAAILVEAAVVTLFFYMGLSRKYVVVKGGKLAAPARARERSQIERLAKGFFVLCALLSLFVLFIPLLRGTIALSCGRPAQTVADEVTNTSTWMGTWFLKQTVDLKNNTPLNYIFSVERPIRIGNRYHFSVLPGTSFVLRIEADKS